MNPHNFQTALDNCIGRIRAGESVGQCLADYPEMAADLLPLLSISADLLELEPLAAAPTAAASGRDAMFAAFDEVEQERHQAGWFMLFGARGSEWLDAMFDGAATPQLGLVGRLALLILGLTVSGGWVANASADSIPGDQLYPVKLLIEDARLSLTFDESSRVSLEAELNERRQNEVQQLQEQGRSADVEFSGRLEAINDDSWLIDGIEVQPIPELIIDEALTVGQTITLNGQVDEDGEITVDRVELPAAPVAPIDAEVPVQNTSTPTTTPTNVPPTATQPIVEPAPTETPVPTQTDIPTTAATATSVPTEPRATDTPVPTMTPSPTAEIPNLNPTATPTEPARDATATPTEPVRDATATPTRERDGNAATREAFQATRAAESTAQAQANQATKEAMATQNAINNQATKEALATQNAINNQATRDAIATQVAATRQAAATATAEAARATHQAEQQATRQANATAAAEATRNAQPTATPVPPSPTPTVPPVPTDTPTPQESDVPSPTPEPSDRPTATPERDG